MRYMKIIKSTVITATIIKNLPDAFFSLISALRFLLDLDIVVDFPCPKLVRNQTHRKSD
jgi:hypothetical protein